MNKEEMRIAIAENCGWEVLPLHINQEFDVTGTPPNNDSGMRYHQVPNYPEDLNAMFEAENTLTAKQQREYVRLLHPNSDEHIAADWILLHSNAMQRAIKFCKVIHPKEFVDLL